MFKPKGEFQGYSCAVLEDALDLVYPDGEPHGHAFARRVETEPDARFLGAAIAYWCGAASTIEPLPDGGFVVHHIGYDAVHALPDGAASGVAA